MHFILRNLFQSKPFSFHVVALKGIIDSQAMSKMVKFKILKFFVLTFLFILSKVISVIKKLS